MNDPFEEKLRALKPAPLPPALLARLADPPAPVSRWHRPLPWGLAALAAAACLAVMVLWPKPQSGTGPTASWDGKMLAESSTRRVVGVQPLEGVAQDGPRAWEFVEVRWVSETTLVSAARPLAAQWSDYHRTVVPVAITFD